MNEVSTRNTRQKGREVIAWAVFSLAISLVLMLSKWIAYGLTSSSAILSDALESGVNVFTSGFVLFAVWLAQQPRDDDHPYGHGRVEFFSSGFEGALIAFAALSIAAVAVMRLLDPVPLHDLELGLAVQGAVSIVTFVSGQFLIHKGKVLGSPSLEADGVHIRADGVTTLGTLLGVAVVWWTGWVWFDTLAALIVAVWLGWSGFSVLRGAVGGLMDEADPEILERIATVLDEAREPGWLAPHHTKVMHLGNTIHIDLHMVFPAYWTIEVVHEASKRIEKAMQAEFGDRTEVMLHMESCTSQSCSYCDMSGCPIRHAPFIEKHPWDTTQITARHRAKPIDHSPE